MIGKNEKVIEWICPSCNQQYNSERELRIHLETKLRPQWEINETIKEIKKNNLSPSLPQIDDEYVLNLS